MANQHTADLTAVAAHVTRKSKTIATWLALLLGTLGVHRLYLKGKGDWLAWLHWPPTLLGLGGVVRMNNLGQDDHWAWLLIPLLGLMLTLSMLTAIVYGLTPDERWAQRHGQPVQATGWAPVLGVIAALMLGGAALMGTLAFGGQKYFEYQRELAEAASDAALAGQKNQKPAQ